MDEREIEWRFLLVGVKYWWQVLDGIDRKRNREEGVDKRTVACQVGG